MIAQALETLDELYPLPGSSIRATFCVTRAARRRRPCMRSLLPLLTLFGCATASGETMKPSDEAPVVIELFTSQGCSSCPPADALLGKLAKAGHSEGRPIVALSFHVDYWNSLGWTDPYLSLIHI